MPRLNSQLRDGRSGLLRYGLAVASFATALGVALAGKGLAFRNVEVPLFLFAVAVTAWYSGPGPAALTVLLSIAFFDYFFTEPRYTFYVRALDLPYLIVFISFALLVAWFSAVRRRVERELLHTRDQLQLEVAERTRQASLLDLTHDTIIVRGMDFVITYWNRGAEELYQWTPEEAIGKRSDQLLKTRFPAPIDQIHAELLRASRWEGELQRAKADGTEVVVASRWSLRRDELDRRVAVMETSNDITEHKRREEEIRGLNQELARRSTELEATNKELEAFAYSVSHDLRAPLRHMSGYAELLQKRASAGPDEKSRRYLLMILGSDARRRKRRW
jgi:PAS domain S-box-containing protein